MNGPSPRRPLPKRRNVPSPAYGARSTSPNNKGYSAVQEVKDREKRQDRKLSPATRAAALACPIETHMALRGAASTSRTAKGAKAKRLSSNQRGFLGALEKNSVNQTKRAEANRLKHGGSQSRSETPSKGRWKSDEDALLRKTVNELGARNWKRVAEAFQGTRTDVQCLHRWNKVLRPGLLKGKWGKEEDKVVIDYVQKIGMEKVRWNQVAERLPGRLGKQCRERWYNHLNPDIKKGNWTQEEDDLLFEGQR